MVPPIGSSGLALQPSVSDHGALLLSNTNTNTMRNACSDGIAYSCDPA
jgi:hypothetical protein